MKTGLNKNYVAFRLRRSSYSRQAASEPKAVPAFEAAPHRPPADTAELITFGAGRFYKRVINSLFARKETLKKIPVIGPLMVRIKRKMANARSGELRFDDIVFLPRRHFVAELYRRALGREADYFDLKNYDKLGFMGLNNFATVYIVCTSREFGGRARVANMNVYRKAYGRYRIKSFILNIPVLGRVAGIFVLPSAIRIIADKFSELESQLESHEYYSSLRDFRMRSNIEKYASQLESHEHYSSLRDFRVRQELEKYAAASFLQSSAASRGLSASKKRRKAFYARGRQGGKK